MEILEKEIYKRYQHLIGDACLGVAGRSKLNAVPQSVDFDTLLDQYDVFCFDGYGTLYNRGDFVYPGALDWFKKLRAAGKQVRLVTNAASDVDEELALAAARRGFDFTAAETISSGSLLKDLVEKLRTGACRGGSLLGEAPLIDAACGFLPRAVKEALYIGRETGLHVLEANGIAAVDDPEEPIVAISSSRETPETYAKAVEILKRPGAILLVLNSDAWAPKINGTREPVSGALCERLRRDSACDANGGEGCVTFYLGKPFPAIWAAVRKSLPLFDGHEPRVIMIGDTLGTDIYGARVAGFDSALLVGRNQPAAELAEDESFLGIRPDWYLVP